MEMHGIEKYEKKEKRKGPMSYVKETYVIRKRRRVEM